MFKTYTRKSIFAKINSLKIDAYSEFKLDINRIKNSQIWKSYLPGQNSCKTFPTPASLLSLPLIPSKYSIGKLLFRNLRLYKS